MNKNKKIIIITIISLIVLTGIYLLYNTYALTTKTTNNGDYYTINLTDSNIVSLAANEEKTVIYQINNTNNGTVSYGVAYNNSNVAVKVYSDSKDKVTGTIGANDNKYVKLHLKNKTSSNTTVEITTVMGYENGGDLIVPSASTLVTGTYTAPISLAKYITNLYTNASKSTVTNNSITYNYATSESLMNDRLGGTTSSLDGGNIRYYGASPNNYVYFNCESYPSTNCELWRIIGVFDGKIKLMRNESIGGMAYDAASEDTYLKSLASSDSNPVVKMLQYDDDSEVTSKLATGDTDKGQNDYSNSSLQKILNNYYYNKLKYTGHSTYDFTSTGIKNDITRNMISETVYYLGGCDTMNIYSNAIYNNERGTTVYSGNSTTWSGKIALPYQSDYGYATDLNKCSQTLSSYGSNTDSYACRSNDWMYPIITNSGSSFGWLLTHQTSSASNVFYINMAGSAGYNAYFGSGEKNIVSPALYLNSNQSIIGGDGSQNNPYQLKA